MELDLVQRIVKASHELPTHVHHFRHDPSHESTGFKPDEKCEDGEAVNYRSIACSSPGTCGLWVFRHECLKCMSMIAYSNG
jgi:hypothetical protein